jgi:hypothetical protein
MEYILSILLGTVLLCLPRSVRAHIHAFFVGCLCLLFFYWIFLLIFVAILLFVLYIFQFLVIYPYQLWLLLWTHIDHPLFNAHPEIQLVRSVIALALVFVLLAPCVQVTRNLVLLGDWGGLFSPIAEQCIEILEYWRRDNGLVRWGMLNQQSPETA